jgi:plastocyanin
VLSAAAVLLGAAACGSSSKSSSAPSSTSSTPSSTPSAPASSTSASTPAAPAGGALTDAADPSGQLKFTQSSLTAKAGKVTVQFSNKSPLPHNLTIAQGSKVLGATPTFSGGTKSLTVNLKPGTYTFYCSVPGHRAAGMVGTLTVQ